jgi:hypothetical protein
LGCTSFLHSSELRLHPNFGTYVSAKKSDKRTNGNAIDESIRVADGSSNTDPDRDTNSATHQQTQCIAF